MAKVIWCTDEHGERRDALDVAREFVREQSEGEWGEEVEERDALALARLLQWFADAPRAEIIIPWQFGGTDCLHKPGHEARCRIMGCPRKLEGRAALSQASRGQTEEGA